MPRGVVGQRRNLSGQSSLFEPSIVARVVQGGNRSIALSIEGEVQRSDDHVVVWVTMSFRSQEPGYLAHLHTLRSRR